MMMWLVLACLGENPYVRMLVDRYGASCKMCQRPFTIFKWRPGRGEGYRKTEVSQFTKLYVLFTLTDVVMVLVCLFRFVRLAPK